MINTIPVYGLVRTGELWGLPTLDSVLYVDKMLAEAVCIATSQTNCDVRPVDIGVLTLVRNCVKSSADASDFVRDQEHERLIHRHCGLILGSTRGSAISR